jgi:hypothetical protein
MLSCAAATRGGSNAELAVPGLVVSGGAVMSGVGAAAGVTDDLSQPLLTPAFTLTRARMPGDRAVSR